MDGWVGEWEYEWMMYGWMGELMEGWVGMWMDECMDE